MIYRGGNLDFLVPNPNLRTFMQGENSKYLAFISYSRADNVLEGRRWAKWITGMIEGFPLNDVPRKVFLDTKSLPAGGELSQELKSYLDASRFLVLICSPNSAGSSWVSAEIEHFKISNGLKNIIPVVIGGKDPDSAFGDHWISEQHRDIAGLAYADFRTKEKELNHSDVVEQGWTSDEYYRIYLRRRGHGAKHEIEAWATAYKERHKVAKYALLAQLFGKEQEELELLEQEHLRATGRQRLLRIIWILAGVALVFGIATVTALRSERVAQRERGRAEQERNAAQRERAKAERSVQLIGDAHESATRMVSDVLVDLRTKLDAGGQAGAFAEAKRIVDEHLEESIPPGNENDSIHMRAVLLDSRGYLARRIGNLPEAESLYRESLKLRQKLIFRVPGKGLYRHNEAVSHDNLGDCHIARAVALRLDQSKARESQDEFRNAVAEYRKSLEISRLLIAGDADNPQWRHALAVGLFKLGDTLNESDVDDDRMEALEKLEEGMKHAEELSASDPEYAKWQAHVGLFCLELGGIHARAVEDDKARACLEKGRGILIRLRERKALTHQYEEWLEQIEQLLQGLG